MVFLGFGKYARADRIYALEPIIGRGAGERPPHARLGRGDGRSRWSPRARRRRSSRRWGASRRPGRRDDRARVARSGPAASPTATDVDRRGLGRCYAGAGRHAARGQPPRRRPRAARLDAAPGRRRRMHRRGRGICAGRSRQPCLPGPDAAQRRHVRRSGDALRLPLLRRPLVRKRHLRAGGSRGGGAAARARADDRARDDASAARWRARPSRSAPAPGA